MPRTGRKPDPTAKRRAGGDKRGLNEHEPAYGTLRATVPGELQRDDEKKQWRRLHSLLSKAGVLTAGDRDALIGLCRLTAAMHREDDNNELVKQLRELRQLWGVFGLSPVDRARLEITPRGKPEKKPGVGGVLNEGLPSPLKIVK